MSFVPLTGPATLHAAEAPRDGTVEFTDARRAAARSPCRSAPRCRCWPRRATDDDAHPSVALLAAASLLAMRLRRGRQVRARRRRAGGSRPLDADDTERLRRLAESRAYAGLAADAAETVVRRLVDAVVDTMPRAAPTAPARAPARRPSRPARPRRPTAFSPPAPGRSSPATAATRPTCPSW